MRLHRVLAHEEPSRDFPVAEAFGDQAQNLEFAWRQPELLDVGHVDGKWPGGRYRHLFHHDSGSRELETKPDPERREERGHQAAIDLERMLDDQESVLKKLEGGQGRPSNEPIEKHCLLHAPTIQRGSYFFTRGALSGGSNPSNGIRLFAKAATTAPEPVATRRTATRFCEYQAPRPEFRSSYRTPFPLDDEWMNRPLPA